MPDFTKLNFPLGWIPSDDEYNGRSDGLLRMDNCQLDDLGIVSNIRGANVVSDQTFGDMYTLFGKSVDLDFYLGPTYPSTAKLRYVWDQTAGNVMRNYGPVGKSLTDFELTVMTGAVQRETNFLAAAGHIFIINGVDKVKDRGDIQEPIGIPANIAPTLANLPAPTVEVDDQDGSGNYTNWDNAPVEGGAYSNAGAFLSIETDSSSNRAIAQLGMDTAVTIDSTDFGAGTGADSPNDIFQFNVRISDTSKITKLRVEFLLQAPTTTSTTPDVTDYYWYEWIPTNITNVRNQTDDSNNFGFNDTPEFRNYVETNFNPNIQQNSTFRPGADVWTPFMVNRGQFNRVGYDQTLDWSTIHGVRFIVIAVEQITSLFNDMIFIGGDDILNGEYSYIQVDCNDTGFYIAHSLNSPDAVITAINSPVEVTPNTVDSQCNMCQIYRCNKSLGVYYLINTQTGAKGFTPVVFNDTMTDVEAATASTQTDGTRLELFRTAIPDGVQGMIVIKDRIIYLTPFSFIPSYLFDPESFDSRFQYQVGTTQIETCLFIAKLTEDQFVVATTVDIYSVTGDFSPINIDGVTIQNLSIRPLGIKKPPVSRANYVINSTLFYLAEDGWRTLSGTANDVITQTTDLLYRGYDRYGIVAFRECINNSTFVDCTISHDRFICQMAHVSGQRVLQIYNTRLNYWTYYNNTENFPPEPLTVFTEEDGTVLVGGAAYVDNYLREFDSTYTQDTTIYIRTKREHFGLLNTRKDIEFTFTVNTGGEDFVASLNGQTMTVNSDARVDFTFPGSTMGLISPGENFWFELTGTTTLFRFYGFSYNYDPRPQKTAFKRVRYKNYGDPRKKRGRTIPFVVDTLGETVTVLGNADGINRGTSTVSSTYPATNNFYFTSDVIATDYELILSGTTGFEFYGDHTLISVEEFPVAKKWDQIGPIEFYKIAPIKGFKVGFIPEGTLILWRVFTDDVLFANGTITVVANKHAWYEVLLSLPEANVKTCRIEFESELPFHRTSAWFKVRPQGRQTEFQYVEVGS